MYDFEPPNFEIDYESCQGDVNEAEQRDRPPDQSASISASCQDVSEATDGNAISNLMKLWLIVCFALAFMCMSYMFASISGSLDADVKNQSSQAGAMKAYFSISRDMFIG